MSDEENPNHRTCFICDQTDNHPKIIHIADASAPTENDDQPYHYDCLPPRLRRLHGVGDDHPAIKATKRGKRGDDVRKAMVTHAHKMYEEDLATREGGQ